MNIGSGKKFGWKMSQILREHRGDFALGFELQVLNKIEVTDVLEVFQLIFQL